MTAFLRGFRDAAHLSMQEADDEWAAFSRQVSDAERRRIERLGYTSGLREGRRWAAMYADELAADDHMAPATAPETAMAPAEVRRG